MRVPDPDVSDRVSTHEVGGMRPRSVAAGAAPRTIVNVPAKMILGYNMGRPSLDAMNACKSLGRIRIELVIRTCGSSPLSK